MKTTSTLAINDSASVRDHLVNALRLDLIGPGPDDTALLQERLPQAPSRWYLTGFLVPSNAPQSQKARDAEEELDEGRESAQGGGDDKEPERGSGKRVYLPSSMGLSVLVDPSVTKLQIAVTWGEYHPESGTADAALESAEDAESASDSPDTRSNRATRQREFTTWVREPREAGVSFTLPAEDDSAPIECALPSSDGLVLVGLVRSTRLRYFEGERDARVVSLFVVNRRVPADEELPDVAYVFQANMSISAEHPFLPRFDAHSLDSDDFDDRLSDLHYRDVAEFAVGHNVSAHAATVDDVCNRVSTEWMPTAAVERVEPSLIENVEFGMETLGALKDGAAASQLLSPLVAAYRNWISDQTSKADAFSGRRREVVDELVDRATRAANRIEAGIEILADPKLLQAFQIANRAMAAAARRRMALERKCAPEEVNPPTWRPFQLAYILMNLRSIADPGHPEREFVDLLFFPTGGGKTEAYLGLAAFTLVLRRLRDPDPIHRGLSVLMRYTLRLLTLDQLGRATALICALELEREAAPEALGSWPFEIALWIGSAATPNHMGKKGDSSNKSARTRTLQFSRDTSRDPPLPLDHCPWCGNKFNKHSFRLSPNTDKPENLLVRCASRHCDFSGSKRNLPIIAVDESIYERLPAFMIATVDKFAALPWTGETAGFFRGGDPQNPRPPDLIIQDELHLISGPLGTMAGLYETAIDQLCLRRINGKDVRPKVIASTATVRLAGKQIRALFGRKSVSVFPSPGIDRRDSFFARQVAKNEENPRLYLGVAAQGRGPKVLFLRSTITLMAAAQAAWEAAATNGGDNPADPYMTLVAYFNALRELGSARRIAEDEINSRLQKYANHRPIGCRDSLFADRKIAFEPVELTSRVGTAQVADAKRRLALEFGNKDCIDIALATNMISVGLDITRLGLMVVSGQPKTTAEYIQATSRVGRDKARPGLVVTLLNVHKPRDRSHYEQFSTWHESFYRGVEVTSVTPFSPRALDRGLPAVSVALSRLGIPELTPTRAAAHVENCSDETARIARTIGKRAQTHADNLPQDFGDEVRNRAQSLIDDWASLAHEAEQGGVSFGYTSKSGSGVTTPLLREMIISKKDALTDIQLRFRSPRSLRDVEPGVLLGIKSPEGKDIK